MRVDLAQRLAGSEKAESRKDGERIAELFQRLLIDDRRAPALDHVGHKRLAESPADSAHFLDAFGAFDEQNIRAGLGIGLGAAESLVEPERRARVGAGNDEKTA